MRKALVNIFNNKKFLTIIHYLSFVQRYKIINVTFEIAHYIKIVID